MQIHGVAESVEQQLRREIIMGNLAAGTRLNETELSQRLGVSRPPLREAFRKLEGENLVVSIPRKGSFVAQLSRQDCEQLYQTRIVLECAAIDILANRSYASLEPLRQTLDAELRQQPPSPEDQAKPERLLEGYEVMAGFHHRLVELCGNRWIQSCYAQLRPTLARYQMVFLRQPDTWHAALVEHGEVLALMRDGRRHEAKAELTRHILQTRDALLQGIGKTQR